MKYAIADTETSGFPNTKPGIMHENQARIVQLALLICDEDGNHKAEFSTLIKPDGWTISEGAFGTHGISEEQCHKYGMPMRTALNVMYDLLDSCDLLVFHNDEFDWKMLMIEQAYAGLTLPDVPRFCTMNATTDICQLPGRYGNYKWPKLSEALPILCGRELGDGAHDAMIDTRGCKDIFFELKRRGF